MEELHEFLKENRRSFPNYFRIRELKNYYMEGKLHKIHLNNKIIGFYVIDGTQFKSFYVNKAYRKTGVTETTMLLVQLKYKYLTLALNKKSSRMMKFAKKYGFVDTGKGVKGKTYDLNIYEYAS